LVSSGLLGLAAWRRGIPAGLFVAARLGVAARDVTKLDSAAATITAVIVSNLDSAAATITAIIARVFATVVTSRGGVISAMESCRTNMTVGGGVSTRATFGSMETGIGDEVDVLKEGEGSR
jgi:hypothetical protein